MLVVSFFCMVSVRMLIILLMFFLLVSWVFRMVFLFLENISLIVIIEVFLNFVGCLLGLVVCLIMILKFFFLVVFLVSFVVVKVKLVMWVE